jgi:catechol 2,3-dioxygenase-like lactoylglutathione lyase family enzyme
MIKFDHLRIPVSDLARSRDWYIRTLGLKVAFEVPNQCSLWFQVADIDTTFTD